jgi:glycine/D-amino acid oxidase-like deaminating enzyme
VVVVGAGVIGSALARRLAEDGWRVTVVERHRPAHPHAASSAESRLIRSAHGADDEMTASAWRARRLWQAIAAEAGRELLVECGVVWFGHRADGWEAKSEIVLGKLGIPHERLTPVQTASLFPSFDGEDLLFSLHEPDAGVIRAREAVDVLVAQAGARGASFVNANARPQGAAAVVGDEVVEADAVVWACGPWLPKLFPDLIAQSVTQQDTFFFGVAADWQTPPTPAWLDQDADVYGVGDLGNGFKLATGLPGHELDPELDECTVSAEATRAARAYLARRFPALSGARLTGGQPCPSTAQSAPVVAPHPEYPSVWLVGGGAGMFKHAPALAEHVADLLTGAASPQASSHCPVPAPRVPA